MSKLNTRRRKWKPGEYFLYRDVQSTFCGVVEDVQPSHTYPSRVGTSDEVRCAILYRHRWTAQSFYFLSDSYVGEHACRISEGVAKFLGAFGD